MMARERCNMRNIDLCGKSTLPKHEIPQWITIRSMRNIDLCGSMRDIDINLKGSMTIIGKLGARVYSNSTCSLNTSICTCI